MDVQVKRWTRDEYERLAQAGVLGEDDRVQLIAGELVQMGPQGASHAAAISAVADALRGLFGKGNHVRVQLPLALGPDSEPEPDVAVVEGSWHDYRDEHPVRALLVVEVAESSGSFDRERKGPVYAGSGIPEYWVIDLTAAAVDVFRDPGHDQGGHPHYETRLRLKSPDTLTPVAVPGRSIIVGDLLP